ncbi:MAG TPA: acyl-CoA dehydrogenase family protein, partial [Arenicellales bacterium]|nr:acyl-CoA dehydrogenase family protein [Arenicellales bacterium]
MDFSLSEEQRMLIDSARAFAEKELYPYEDEVETSDQVRPELAQQIRERALAQGFYAANMPEDLGGGGLDCVSLSLVERELGRANFALQYLVGRPSNILQACVGEQRDRYL